MTAASRFHYSFCVDDLATARDFYLGTLACPLGRESETWFDVDFFGHELSLHQGTPLKTARTGKVDGILVPMPHFGVILTMHDWEALRDRLIAAGTEFIVSPRLRFEGQPGEQATMFFEDPAGNALEAKGFRNLDQLFAS